MLSEIVPISDFGLAANLADLKGCQECHFEFTYRWTMWGTREFNHLSFLPQEQCFVILKQNTLLKAQGKITLDTHKIFTRCTQPSDHLLWFWPKEKNNFIVAFTVYPYYHGSKMLPNVQYTDTRSSLTLLITVNIVQDKFERIMYSKIFFIIIHLLCCCLCHG